MDTASEQDLDELFEDLDLSSSKLGKTASAKNRVITTDKTIADYRAQLNIEPPC